MIEPEIRGGQIRRSQRNTGGSQETVVRTTVDEVLGRVAEFEPMIRAASAEAEIERRLSAHRGRGAAGRGVLAPVPAA